MELTVRAKESGWTAGEKPMIDIASNEVNFARLSEQYRKQLFRVAHRITRTREDAEDAVQDTLLRAFVHIADFEGRSNMGTWLTSITINSALMTLRKKRASPEIAIGCNNDFGVGSLCDEIPDHAPNSETCYAQSEKKRILRTAIRRLRPKLQVAVQIQLQGRSMRETAEALGISLTAAKARLFHAKKALRRSLITKLAGLPRGDRLCVFRPGLAGTADIRTQFHPSAIELQEKRR
jgi:RNA polymerase sigma factor (sigma-70 family)